jgi:aspartyl-tRNA(Asn)/glutamyl-tRNA(Gln) amidotransferase subunit A
MHQSDLALSPVHALLIDDPDARSTSMPARVSPPAGPSRRKRISRRCSSGEAMKLSFAAALDGIDALLTSTMLTAALPLDGVDQTSASAHYTRFGNFLDLCALSLPNGFARDGLPISLQIVCRSYHEATALRIGRAL